jgi:hypothetical protein
LADSAGLIASPERIANLHYTERVEIRVEELLALTPNITATRT